MRLAAALAVLALLSGCNVVQQLDSHKIIAAAVIRSPDVNAGPPANVNVPGTVTAQLFFGQRQNDPSQAPTGLGNATVTLSWSGAATGSVTLPAGPTAGSYMLTGNLIAYQPGLTYTFTVGYNGETFSGSVTAPQPIGITELSGAAVPNVFPPTPDYAASFTHQTVTRTGNDIAFYAVAPVQGTSSLGAISCSNAPLNDPASLVQLFLDPSPWQVASFDLWRTDLTQNARQKCFAPGTGAWVVSLTALKTGTVSSNLFLGSGVLAGASDAGVLVLQ